MALELIDVSVWNAVQSWDAVAGTGLAGVIAKTSEGVGFRDPSWVANQAALLAPGPLIGGSYHFLRPDLGNNPVDEADWYLSCHDGKVFEPTTPWIFALDAESAGGSSAGCQAFMDRISQQVGYSAWFYSFSSWIADRGISAANRPLWLAWPDSNGPNPPSFSWPAISQQQYGASGVAGVIGNVDRNRFFGDRDQLLLLAGFGVTPPKPALPLGGGGSGETTMVISQHPTIEARLDLTYIGTDGNVWHSWSQGVDASASFVAGAPTEGWNAPPGGAVAGILAATWDLTGQFFNVFAADKAGQMWTKLMGLDGSVHRDWTAVKDGRTALPVGPKGDVGATGQTGATGLTGATGATGTAASVSEIDLAVAAALRAGADKILAG